MGLRCSVDREDAGAITKKSSRGSRVERETASAMANALRKDLAQDYDI